MAVYHWLDETTNGTGVVSQLAYVDDCTDEGRSRCASVERIKTVIITAMMDARLLKMRNCVAGRLKMNSWMTSRTRLTDVGLVPFVSCPKM